MAGGRGSRLGGGKASVELGGRALISYPLAAIEAAGLEAVVCAKPGQELPPLLGSSVGPGSTEEPSNEVPVLEEPARPRHPLCGVVAALRVGEGAEGPRAPTAVVAIACDMPFVSPDLVAHLAAAEDPLVVPSVGGRLHPLLGRYEPCLLPRLETALEREEPLTRTVESLDPRLLTEDDLSRFGDPRRLLFNVNDPDDVRQAEALL
ncbi:MAG: molybdenum cofactor guanylyltransferase [Solirubrobacterales bacterium]